MKRKVRDFVKSIGFDTCYSGKTKTMYIKGDTSHESEAKVLEEFGYHLPFKISSY